MVDRARSRRGSYKPFLRGIAAAKPRGRVGRRYANVNEIVSRTRVRLGFHFAPHMFRHTYATLARRGGVPVEIVSKLLTHSSIQTTSQIYLHSSPEDLRAELERAGVMAQLDGAL